MAWICNLNEIIMSTDKIVTTGPIRLIALTDETTVASYTVCIMMTSSNGNIFRVTGHLCRELTGDKGQWSFDVFFNLRPNKRLNKQSWGWWFETLSRPLWRHCKDICLHHIYYIPILPKTFELTGVFFYFFFIVDSTTPITKWTSFLAKKRVDALVKKVITDASQMSAYCTEPSTLTRLNIWWPYFMMTSSNGNIFRVTGFLCGEFTGHRWIPPTEANDAVLRCFLCSAPE